MKLRKSQKAFLILSFTFSVLSSILFNDVRYLLLGFIVALPVLTLRDTYGSEPND